MLLRDMYRAVQLKKQLDEKYFYEKLLTDSEINRLKNTPEKMYSDLTASALTVGCVKLEMVIGKVCGSVGMWYCLFVKDAPDSPEWILYERLAGEAETGELSMLAALDKAVTENGLSYTECCFDRLDGTVPRSSLKK